jgi:murein DD-endopeptidase MepM/ murein hydrolase activator NlpD
MLKVKSEKRKRLVHRLKNQYRLSILNSATYEEKLNYELTPINVIVASVATFITLGFAFISLVVFTPLKEFIPGFTDTEIRASAYQNALLVDSLGEELRLKSNYVNSLRAILRNESEGIDDIEENREESKYQDIDLSISEEDSLFRLQYEEQEAFNVGEETPAVATGMSVFDLNFFIPVKGYITSRFSLQEKHYGVDIVAPRNEVVKAIAKGTVIQSSWTSESGNVLGIQHNNNLVSFYKHNSVLLKKVGETVEAGESIAVLGNTGEETTGPHVHFELWRNGVALDPEQFIVFE